MVRVLLRKDGFNWSVVAIRDRGHEVLIFERTDGYEDILSVYGGFVVAVSYRIRSASVGVRRIDSRADSKSIAPN